MRENFIRRGARRERMKGVKATEKSERGNKEKSERKKDRLKEKHPLQTHVRNSSIYNNFCCGKLSVLCLSSASCPSSSSVSAVVLLSETVLCVPVLYQSVRLGIGVVALFQVSSGVQQ